MKQQSPAVLSLVAHINAKQVKITAPKKAMNPKKGAKEYPRLRFIAEQEPEEMAGAISQLHPMIADAGTKLAAMTETLGLSPIPKDAPLKVRVAARRKYAEEFRRIAEEHPEEFANMLSEVYQQLEQAVESVEILAENTDVELAVDGGSTAAPFGEGVAPAEAVEEKVDDVREEAKAASRPSRVAVRAGA
jgi:hypothetical protein